MKRKLRMGMIGGGRGAFIGAVHRMASSIDGLIELKAGAFSSRSDVALASGRDLFLEEDRIYPDYKTMILAEAGLPEDRRIDFVSIVTPNFAHFEPAMMALENGFHVVIEKPMTFTLDEAKRLQKKVEETGLLLCLTHTYSGYPMVKEARNLVREGAIGKVRKIMVEYVQGWLSRAEEQAGNVQASWRTDPGRSGAAGCMGDIGTHAAHLAEYVSGLKIQELCADLNIVVPGRALDDDGNVLLKFEGGVSGTLVASQIAAGEENNLTLRIYGEKGGIEWRQQEPNTLMLKHLDRPAEVWRTGVGKLSSYAVANTRTPGGHPEGYLEAFANLYRNFALTLMAMREGQNPSQEMMDFPTVNDGVRGMAFIENVVASSRQERRWRQFSE
ncbi:MAG: Gfo/Idh/MocA family oxidoreductase [Chitinophagaceae bacterium]|nr:Gfo/Idh/MocA family oxidoreductase [Chitinophagaceae bacterium]MCW5914961.1 Gfo/Idh/MocA family oxidoreductase [Chitinophagaceae bacterium]MCZ2396770.1 Gfo/Idh/MocA family oxidoreductase [Chitinophagales bacterium]